MNRRLRSSLLWIAVVAALLVLLRLTLPYWVERYVNARMAQMGDYRGHVAEVDLHLWRGAYTLHTLLIEKTGADVPVPLLEAPQVELSLSWPQLARGRIVAKVEFQRPKLNFVDGRSARDGQAGRGVDWREQLEALVPTRLDEVRVVDGEIVFHNFFSNPPVDLEASAVNGSVRNLTNVRDDAGERVATLDARAQILGQAPLEWRARFDPFNELQDFSMDLRVTDVQLPQINELARAYAQLDFASGSGDFVMELDARDGKLRGYAKPLFRDLEILDWKQDVVQDGDNPLRYAWEALAGAVSDLFKNRPADQLATRVEISGEIGNARTGTLDAIVGVLRNAFVEAFKPQFENLRED